MDEIQRRRFRRHTKRKKFKKRKTKKHKYKRKKSKNKRRSCRRSYRGGTTEAGEVTVDDMFNELLALVESDEQLAAEEEEARARDIARTAERQHLNDIIDELQELLRAREEDSPVFSAPDEPART